MKAPTNLVGSIHANAQIRAARRRQALHIDDAASLCGVSVDLLSRLENGKGSVGTDKVLQAWVWRCLWHPRGMPAFVRWFSRILGMAEQHVLSLWANELHVADITHDARQDAWDLTYSPDWCRRADSFALCPSLPLPEPGKYAAVQYRSGAIKRFLENLLPEGQALDAVVASQRVSKNNIFGLVRTIGAESTGAFRFLTPDDVGAGVQPGTPPRNSMEALYSLIGQMAAEPRWLNAQTLAQDRRIPPRAQYSRS
ncbi:HipA N-terminal domain-containing protein [Streptomyces albidoflavus]